MANNKKDVSTRTSIDNLNDSMTSVEQHVENNPKIIIWTIVGIIVCAALILGYIYGISIPGKEKANQAISQADIQLTMGNDSVALLEYMNVADDYSNASGSRAALQAAIMLFEDGKYEDALSYIGKAKIKESVVAAAAQSLEGDCYVNLNNNASALKAFDSAIKTSDKNPLYTPIFMMKKATVLNAEKQYAEALSIYETIEKDYPEFTMNYQVELQKYIARAKAQAGVE